MKEKHIVDILESAPLASLDESQLRVIRTHVESCVACARAYRAAQLSNLLIKERAAESVEPSAEALQNLGHLRLESIAIDGNPLKDIKAMTRVTLVMKDGVTYDGAFGRNER